MTFGHDTVVSITPDLYWHTCELGFTHVEALRLSGPAAPWYTIALASLLYERRQLADLPAFGAYRDS